MKTPTLIVRLVALYLLCTGLYGLYTMANIPQTVAFASKEIQTQLELTKYMHGAMACIGFVATRYAGWFARIMTFDSEAPAKDLASRIYDADTKDSKTTANL